MAVFVKGQGVGKALKPRKLIHAVPLQQAVIIATGQWQIRHMVRDKVYGLPVNQGQLEYLVPAAALCEPSRPGEQLRGRGDYYPLPDGRKLQIGLSGAVILHVERPGTGQFLREAPQLRRKIAPGSVKYNMSVHKFLLS